MRAAIYTRLSKRTDTNVPNIETQREDCQALCDREGWAVVAVCSDLGESAFERDDPDDRDGYADLLDLVRAGGVDVVVAIHPDRCWRDGVEQGLFLRDARKAGLQFVAFVNGSRIDPANPDDEFVLDVLTAVSKKESADKRRRLRRKARQLAEAGKVGGGGSRPFAYENDRITVRWEEAKYLRGAAGKILAGASLREVCRWLDAEGCKPVRGGVWRPGTLKQVLTAPRVAGLRQHQGKNNIVGPAEWEGILSRELWEGVKAVLEAPERGGSNGSRRGQYKYLLSRWVYCADCGAPLIARATHNKQRSYVCARGPGLPNQCGGRRIQAPALEAWFVDQLIEHVATQPGAPQQDVDPALEAAVQALEARLDRLRVEYAEEDLWTKEEFLRSRDSLARQLEKARAELIRAVEESEGAPQFPIPEGGEEGGWADGLRTWNRTGAVAGWWVAEGRTLGEQREFLGRWLERIEVGAGVRGRNRFDPDRVTVRWRA